MSESPQHAARRSLHGVEWLNFFLADVQTGLGPSFLAAYLASSGWNPGSVGYALTFSGVVSVVMQAPAGAAIDAVRHKPALLAVSIGLLVMGALLLMKHLSATTVYSAQFLIGGAGPFLFLGLAGIALLAFAILLIAIPETLPSAHTVPASPQMM